jgi:hypothetical protein
MKRSASWRVAAVIVAVAALAACGGSATLSNGDLAVSLLRAFPKLRPYSPLRCISEEGAVGVTGYNRRCMYSVPVGGPFGSRGWAGDTKSDTASVYVRIKGETWCIVSPVRRCSPKK